MQVQPNCPYSQILNFLHHREENQGLKELWSRRAIGTSGGHTVAGETEQVFQPNLVLPIGGQASNISFMERVKLKNVLREFVEKTQTKIRLIGNASNDAGLTLFTSFLQYFTPEFLNRYVRVTGVVSRESLEKCGYQIYPADKEEKHSGSGNVLWISSKSDNTSLNTFFNELLVIEKNSEEEISKFIIGLGAEFAKESQSGLNSPQNNQSGTISNSSNPLENRVVAVCGVLAENNSKVLEKMEALLKDNCCSLIGVKVPALPTDQALIKDDKYIGCEDSTFFNLQSFMRFEKEDVKYPKGTVLKLDTRKMETLSTIFASELVRQCTTNSKKQNGQKLGPLALYSLVHYAESYQENVAFSTLLDQNYKEFDEWRKKDPPSCEETQNTGKQGRETRDDLALIHVLECCVIVAVKQERFWFLETVSRNVAAYRGLLTQNLFQNLYSLEQSSPFLLRIWESKNGKFARVANKLNPAKDYWKESDEKKFPLWLIKLFLGIFGKDYTSWYTRFQSITFSQKLFQNANDHFAVFACVNFKPVSLDYFWQRSSFGVFGSMCIVAILDFYLSKCTRLLSWKEEQSLMEQIELYKTRTLELMQECSVKRTSFEQIREVVKQDRGNFAGVFTGCTPISFAQRIGFKEFAASPGCEDILLKEWYGELRVNNSLLLLNLAQFVPFLYLNIDYVKDREIVELENDATKIKASKLAGSGEKKPEKDIGFLDRAKYPFEYLRLFCYFTPFSTFWWYAFSKIWFVLYFSAFLLFFYDERIHWWSDHAIMEVFLWYWQFNLFGEVIYQGSKTGVGNILQKYMRYFSDVWNSSELVTTLFMLIAGVIRGITPDNVTTENSSWVTTAKLFYGLCILTNYFKLMHTFSVVEALGPKVLMLTEMIKDTLSFLLIIFITCCGFGIGSEFLLLQQRYGEVSEEKTIKKAFDHTYWPMLGDIGGMLQVVDSNIWMANGTEYAEQFDQFFSSVNSIVGLLFFFAFILQTNIILLNLLIAVYSFTFEKIQDQSIMLFKYHRYIFQSNFILRRIPVPPPFSAPVIIYQLISWGVKKRIRRNKILRKIFPCMMKSEDKLAEQAWKRHEDTNWQIGIKQTMLLKKRFSNLDDIREKLSKE